MSSTPVYSPDSRLLSRQAVGVRHANAKVAIPPLLRPRQQQQGSSRDRRRVGRACDACHDHKVKCSGERPRCKHCESTGRECNYPTSRKDRNKILSERCAQMAGYLKTLKTTASAEEAARIGELLEQVESDLAGLPQMRTSSNTDADVDGEDSQGSPALVGDSTALPQYGLDVDSQDLLDEDLHQTDRSRATGFFGKNSEVQWLRTLLNQDQPESASSGTTGRRRSSAPWNNSDQVSQVTFYLDAEDIDIEVDVEPYELPPAKHAEHLLGVYMDKVHNSFPILSRRLFVDQFHKCFQGVGRGVATPINRKWLGVINLVFAISVQYSYFVGAEWPENDRAHLIYHARARKCAWNNVTLSSHPDLPQIQVAGLLALYYLSIGQVSRAWVVVGIAIRLAQSLGLHIRNEDPSASGAKREVLVRIWWSLYCLDRQLSIITGRPSVIIDSGCSVPLPMPLSEEQINAGMAGSPEMSPPGPSTAHSATSSSFFVEAQYMTGVEGFSIPLVSNKAEANSGSFFKAIVHMATITQAVLSTLYSSASLGRLIGQLQQEVRNLSLQLDDWLTALPEEFNFQDHELHQRMPGYRERVLLGFQFYEAKILLTRPYLGKMGRVAGNESSPSHSSNFLQNAASMCVEAAKAELDLLPDQPAPRFIYENAPWWNYVHHLTQAAVALLLGLSSSFFPFQEIAAMTGYTKKAIRWLRSMRDILAYRAYHIVLKAFSAVAESLSIDITDLLTEHEMVYSRGKPTAMETTGGGQMGSALAHQFPPPSHGHFDPNLDVPLAQSQVPPYGFWNPAQPPFQSSPQPDEDSPAGVYYSRLE